MPYLHFQKVHQLPTTYEFPAQPPLSPLLGPEQFPLRSGFLKAEHTAPVCTSRSRSVAKGQLFGGGGGWSLDVLTCEALVVWHNVGLRARKRGRRWGGLGSEDWKLASQHPIPMHFTGHHIGAIKLNTSVCVIHCSQQV